MTISDHHCQWKSLALSVASQVSSPLPNAKDSNYANIPSYSPGPQFLQHLILSQIRTLSFIYPYSLSTLLIWNSLKSCLLSCTLYVRLAILGKAAIFKSERAARLPPSTGTEMDLEVDLWRGDAPLLKDVACFVDQPQQGTQLLFSFLSPPHLLFHSSALHFNKLSLPSFLPCDTPFLHLATPPIMSSKRAVGRA